MIHYTGGNWHYDGNLPLDMTISSDNPNITTWRVNYPYIDFERLRRITPYCRCYANAGSAC
jgi:hypothetical protein